MFRLSYIQILLIIVIFYIAIILSDVEMNNIIQCVNDSCLVSVSTSFVLLIASITLGMILFNYKQYDYEFDESEAVSFFARFGAVIIDMHYALIIILPLSSIIPLFLEFIITGNFSLSFERDFIRPYDYIVQIPSIIASFVLVYYYFYWHLSNDKATVGQYILGYRIVFSDTREPGIYHKRVRLSMLGLWFYPYYFVKALMDKHNSYWDQECATQVKNVKYKK